MQDFQLCGMQEKGFHGFMRLCFITDDGDSMGLGMDAYLVRAAGFRGSFPEKHVFMKFFDPAKRGFCGFPVNGFGSGKRLF